MNCQFPQFANVPTHVVAQWYSTALLRQGMLRAECERHQAENQVLRQALNRAHARLQVERTCQLKLRSVLKNVQAAHRLLEQDREDLRVELEKYGEIIDNQNDDLDTITDQNHELAQGILNVRSEVEDLADNIEHNRDEGSSRQQVLERLREITTAIDVEERTIEIRLRDHPSDSESEEEDEHDLPLSLPVLRDISKRVSVATGPQDDAQCPICLVGFKDGQSRTTLPCGHKMHDTCCTMYFSVSSTGNCPMCRKQLWHDDECVHPSSSSSSSNSTPCKTSLVV